MGGFHDKIEPHTSWVAQNRRGDRLGAGDADDLHGLVRTCLYQRAHRLDRDAGLQRAPDGLLRRRRRRRVARVRTGSGASERRRRRRHAAHLLVQGARRHRHPRPQSRVCHRRHADQLRRGTRLRPVDDREGRRDHDLRRVLLGCGDCRARPVPGRRHHLHGRSHPLERHHRQGQTRERLPSFLQYRNVGPRTRPDPRGELWHRPQGLPPDRRLHLGLEPGKVDAHLHRGAWLGNRGHRAHAGRRGGLSRPTSPRFCSPAPMYWS